MAELGFDLRRLTAEAGSTSALAALASPHSFPCWDGSFSRTSTRAALHTHSLPTLDRQFLKSTFSSVLITNIRLYFHTLSFNCLRVDIYAREKKSHRTQCEKQILVKYFVKSHCVLLPKQLKIIKFLCILWYNLHKQSCYSSLLMSNVLVGFPVEPVLV